MDSFPRWWNVLYPFFALLCLRFITAASVEAVRDTLVPTLIIVIGNAALGAWRPRAALSAFTLAVPCLIGLTNTGMMKGTDLPSLVFAAMWLGIAGKRALGTWEGKRVHFRPADDVLPLTTEIRVPPTAVAPMTADTAKNRKSPLLSARSFPNTVTGLLITLILASLCWQIGRNCASPQFWPAFWKRAVHDRADQHYYLTAAFVWLQGLFCFKELITSDLPRALWLRPFIYVYGATLLTFFLIQHWFKLPEGWTPAGYQSPYEDIHSFGGIAVAVMIFAAATLRKSSPIVFAGSIAFVLVLLGLTIASWSRASWLAGATGWALIVFCRTAWKTRIGLALVGFGLLIAINQAAKTPAWQAHPYLWRVGRLIQFEGPVAKDPIRMNLYGKALRMIRARPLTGHGIGSFYLQSVNFARPDDPRKSQPEFAHNALIQIAAEQGIPAALLVTGLCGYMLWLGLQYWGRTRRGVSYQPRRTLLTLGATIALAVYMQTQMTANSLNIYVSNQFFFWFMMAAVFHLAYDHGVMAAPAHPPAQRT